MMFDNARYIAPRTANAPMALFYQRRQLLDDLAATITRGVGRCGRKLPGDVAHARALNRELDTVLRKLKMWANNAPFTLAKVKETV